MIGDVVTPDAVMLGDRAMKKQVAGAILALAAMLGTAGFAMAQTDQALNGTWTLASVDGRSITPSGEVPNFVIEGDAIHGYDGCNRFSGTLSKPEMMIVGQRACAGDYVSLPLDLTNPKAHLAQAEVEGENLIIPAWNGFPASVFAHSE
jgi:hypothetical protein